MNMRYVDANQTRLIDEYVHKVASMLVKYIQYMHTGSTRPTVRFLFGKRLGRHDATQARESSLWGTAADMTELVWDSGCSGLTARQERQRLLKEVGPRVTR